MEPPSAERSASIMQCYASSIEKFMRSSGIILLVDVPPDAALARSAAVIVWSAGRYDSGKECIIMVR